jgi:hypothetical protein
MEEAGGTNMTNFHNTTLTLILVLLGGLAALALWALRRWKAEREIEESLDSQAENDLMRAVEDWLEPTLFALVTRAERELGSGTGRLKLADVIAKVAAILPEKVKALVDVDWLAARVEVALQNAKAAWVENPGLLDIAVKEDE